MDMVKVDADKEKVHNRNYQQVERIKYIHYNAEHVYWKNIWSVMQQKGTKAIDEGLVNIKKRYQKQLIDTQKIKITSSNDNNMLESIIDLTDEDLTDMLENLAKYINEEIQSKKFSSLVTTFQNTKKDLSTLIKGFYKEDGEVDKKNFKKIFEAVGKILITLDKSTTKEFNQFKNTYLAQLNEKDRTKSKFYNPNANGVVEITSENPVLQKIIKAFNNIPQNIKNQKDPLSTKSIMSSISNTCMSSILGEQMIKFISSNLDSNLGDGSKITVSVTGGNQVKSFSNSYVSQKSDTTASTYKQLFTTDLCNLSAKANQTKDELSVQFMLDSSIKWYQEQNKNNKFGQHISIHSTTGNILASLALKIFGNYEYGVYNTLVFAKEDKLGESKENSFRILRSAVISNYLEKFLAGQGQTQDSLGAQVNDTAVFFVVNAHFYSIMSILGAYITDATRGKQKYKYGSSRQNDLVFISLGSLSSDNINKWNKANGKPEKKDWRLALSRSDSTTRRLLLSFPVNVNLNSNILKNLIQTNNVQPVM